MARMVLHHVELRIAIFFKASLWVVRYTAPSVKQGVKE